MSNIDFEDQEYINNGLLDFTDEGEYIGFNAADLYGVVIYVNDEGYYIEHSGRFTGGNIYSFYSPEPESQWIGESVSEEDYVNHPVPEVVFKSTVVYNDFLAAIEDFKLEFGEDTVEYIDTLQTRKDSYDDFRTLLPLDRFEKKHPPVEELCKSNTLVFHKEDPTTVPLAQVYEGKGWDLIRVPLDSFTEAEKIKLFNSHDRLVFLGHGSPYGLMGMFSGDQTRFFKNKSIFAIWCNADKYFEKYGLGKGCFISKNVPSDKLECRMAGCGNISENLMDKNITFWDKLCADKIEEFFNGNLVDSLNDIRKKYLEQYGNHPVSIYNAYSANVIGLDLPLPSYTFKGLPLSKEDQPIVDFDETEFLKHPVPDARSCPKK